MEYIRAAEKDTEQIFAIVQDTIRSIYPSYYPQEVVDFFCRLHCKERILADIQSGLAGVLQDGGILVGTGCHKKNHITRVYVKPEYQGRGCGSYIMQYLENEICLQYDTVYLDASLPASRFYEKRGYQTVEHKRHPVENGKILAYEVMAKSRRSAGICRDGGKSKGAVIADR